MRPADLRAEMPALDDTVYLNTGASGPSPRSVVDAATAFLRRHAFESPGGEGMYPVAWEELDRAREAVAGLIGAAPAEVALTQSTADGIARVATALPWEEGDVVVRTDLEHAAGVLPWRRLADAAGVEIRVHETEHGQLDLERLTEQLDGADLLCLSSLSWNYGTRLRVSEATEIAHEAGARVLVDAVQSPGQMEMDVRAWGADFVAAAGHKWLLGPWGAGFLYVAEGATEALSPRHVGYRSVEEPNAEGYSYHPDARRLEVGTRSPAPYAGLREAIHTMEEIGLPTVETRVERLTDRLKEGLGERLLGPRAYESGLITFEAAEPEATVERLAESGIVVRSLPYPEAVRASVHAFNAADDVDRLLDALD